MPIVVVQSGSSATPITSTTATTTVGTVLDLVSEDLREQFATSGSTSILIDYTNRIQQMLLGRRRWKWMLSATKRFITERGQSDYWIGTTGSQAAGQVDTLLNLTDVGQVRQGSVLSRSGFAPLHNESEAPLGASWQNEDGSYAEGVPAIYRNDPETPNVVSLYPAPDEGSTYELVPPAPHSTTATGGALAARTYFIRTTFVDLAGNEGEPSATARQFVEASKLLTVKAPQPAISVGSAGVSYLRYNVYASTTEGSETLQNVTATATSTDWTEAASGLTTSGAAVPTSFNLEPLRGYVIEFRYYRRHAVVDDTSDVLFVPDEYRDVVVAGVNWLAAQYLARGEAVGFWADVFKAGIARMVQNENPWPGGVRYIKPDSRAYINRDAGVQRWSWWNPDL